MTSSGLFEHASLDVGECPTRVEDSIKMERSDRFPIGASITIEQLTSSPYDSLARLRAEEPVSWIPALGAWFITRRDFSIEAMRDADRFTVDDDRFTTARVLGPSMLSLDGDEHARHRKAFTGPFRPKVVREQLESRIQAQAVDLVEQTLGHQGELRTGVAGPLAVQTILDVLGLDNVDADDVLEFVRALQSVDGPEVWFQVNHGGLQVFTKDPIHHREDAPIQIELSCGNGRILYLLAGDCAPFSHAVVHFAHPTGAAELIVFLLTQGKIRSDCQTEYKDFLASREERDPVFDMKAIRARQKRIEGYMSRQSETEGRP